MELSGILRSAMGLISNRAKWSKGHYRLGDHFCSVGALAEVCGGQRVRYDRANSSLEFEQAQEFLRDIIIKHTRATSATNIEQWNDNPAQTHSNVMRVWQLAVEAAEAQELAKQRVNVDEQDLAVSGD